jgi:hypothetical protein
MNEKESRQQEEGYKKGKCTSGLLAITTSDETLRRFVVDQSRYGKSSYWPNLGYGKFGTETHWIRHNCATFVSVSPRSLRFFDPK